MGPHTYIKLKPGGGNELFNKVTYSHSEGSAPPFHLRGLWFCPWTPPKERTITTITLSQPGSRCVTHLPPSITPTLVSISPLSALLTVLMFSGPVHVRLSVQGSAKGSACDLFKFLICQQWKGDRVFVGLNWSKGTDPKTKLWRTCCVFTFWLK